MQSHLELNKQTWVVAVGQLYQHCAFPKMIPPVAQSDVITQVSSFPLQIYTGYLPV